MLTFSEKASTLYWSPANHVTLERTGFATDRCRWGLAWAAALMLSVPYRYLDTVYSDTWVAERYAGILDLSGLGHPIAS